MGKLRSSASTFNLDSTPIEDFLTQIQQTLNQPGIDVRCLGDSGPRSLIDSYTYEYGLDGHNDFVNGAVDDLLFGLVGVQDGAPTIYAPTGAAAGADDPNYEGSGVLAQYTITSRVGQAVDFSARLTGAGTLERAVA